MSTHSKLNEHHNPEENQQSEVSRRDFLRLAGVAAASALVGACKPKVSGVSSEATQKPSGKKAQVAIAKVIDYNQDTINQAVSDLIKQLGGLQDVVKPGNRVAIKPNLTGGVNSGTAPGGVSAKESFITHPNVVRALINEVKAAGAKEVLIVESVYEWASYTQWGYVDVANATGATLIDLNDFKPYENFIEATVGDDSYIYPKFTMNKILQDVDVFMSVSKMKNHYNAGVTHTMKNLYGLVPYRFYTLNKGDAYRSAFHGTEDQTRTRLPRVIIDVNRTRTINFSLIDGIKTAEGGEGPWIATFKPVAPGVLLAGKNPVSTDAVATAVMGHNPTADYPDAPFIRCDNHLNLAAARGLGTNKLEEIEVVGETIESVRFQFNPAT